MTAVAARAGLHDLGAFIRFSALGGTSLITLLGAASAVPGLTGRDLPGLLAVTAAWHIFIYVLNDVVDLPIDRYEPRRASSPLVRGKIRPEQALAIALAQVPIALGLTAMLGGDVRALGAFAAGLVLGAAYDWWGKRARVPMLTDTLQGFAWAALALWAAALVGSWTPLTGVVALFVVMAIVMINGIHGALRDLANDVRCGARSTAIFMGAHAGPDGQLVLPRPLRRYAVGLQAALIGIALAPLLLVDLGYDLAGWTGALPAVLLLAAANVACLVAAARSLDDRHRLRLVGMLHVILLMALPIPLLVHRLAPPLLAAMLTAYLAPTLTNHSILGASRKGVTQRLGTLMAITRVENCLATALAVGVGGYLAGGTAALASGRQVCAALVAALIVAAVNVVNDREDLHVDTFGKPGRPLPSGRISPTGAGYLALVLAVGGVLLSLTLGVRLAVMAASLLLLGLAYCYRLKSTVLVGNLVVALLAGCTVAFGAQVAGRLTIPAVIASLLLLLFMLGFEVLKTLADREADAHHGLRTVATVWGAPASIQVYRAVALTLLVVMLLPWPLGLGSVAYACAGLLTGVIPTVVTMARLGRTATSRSVEASTRLLKIAWLPGLLALATLR
jgi:4-hydroxybenzoate polyprenyltransferase